MPFIYAFSAFIFQNPSFVTDFFVTLAYSPSYNALGIKNKQNERLSNAIYKGAGSAGAHDSSTSLFYCIGQGTNGTCGTVTIGGKVGYVKGRDYTYEPGN